MQEVRWLLKKKKSYEKNIDRRSNIRIDLVRSREMLTLPPVSSNAGSLRSSLAESGTHYSQRQVALYRLETL